MSDLGGTRKEWRGNGHWRRKCEATAAVCTDVILIGSELSTLSSNALEILLSRSVGIADLEQETLLANGLAVELPNDLLTDLAGLKTGRYCQSRASQRHFGGFYRAKPTPRLLFWLSRRILLELTV